MEKKEQMSTNEIIHRYHLPKTFMITNKVKKGEVFECRNTMNFPISFDFGTQAH